MALTDRKPRGLVRVLLRSPIWFYRARLGVLFGHRLVCLAHRGRRSGVRREVVVEVVRYDAAVPEVVVVAAWGGVPDWFRNLRAAPAIEVRVGGQRWVAPVHRELEAEEVRRTLLAYQRALPRAWRRLAPLLGFPNAPDDARWPEVAARVHALAFTPGGTSGSAREHP
jgi:deazaflavin-dependent oxidoreductase (nitroreductase family)